jgi:hypothetical protein
VTAPAGEADERELWEPTADDQDAAHDEASGRETGTMRAGLGSRE